MKTVDDGFLSGEGNMLCVCTCCGTMLRVHGAMGDWIRTCFRCERQCEVADYAERDDVARWIAKFPACPHPVFDALR